MPKKDKKQEDVRTGAGSNADLEGVDKAPGEERGKAEEVANKDLKGKKVDADPSKKSDKPLS